VRIDAGARGAEQRYSVRVFTSDVRGAGTDADVSLVLLGDPASGMKSEELVLADSANNFERNQVDEFPINLKV